MTGDGKFKKGKYTTIPETKNVKLPVGGRIRLGEKVKTDKGVSYPKELDYFKCPKRVQDIYGEKPTELIVFFPSMITTEIFPQSYEKYLSNEALVCQGDGKTEAQRLNMETGQWEKVKCPCEHYGPYDKNTKIGGCDKRGHLKFMIPSVSITTFFEMGVSGTVSVEEINSAFKYAELITGGSWKMIPFKMRRVPVKIRIPGTINMKTHWVVTLEIAASTEEIMRVRSGEILYLGQKKNTDYQLEETEPSRGKTEVALIEDTEEDRKAREAEAAEKVEAATREYEESVARTAQLKKEMEEGQHEILSYREAKAISQNNNGLATQAQKDMIYGIVVCEECGKKNVYGFKCPKCQNTNLHVITDGIYQDPLLKKDDFKNELEPTKDPLKLTEIAADKIFSWWLVERAKRNKEEKVTTPAEVVVATKDERITAAKDIVEKTKKRSTPTTIAEDFISK